MPNKWESYIVEKKIDGQRATIVVEFRKAGEETISKVYETTQRQDVSWPYRNIKLTEDELNALPAFVDDIEIGKVTYKDAAPTPNPVPLEFRQVIADLQTYRRLADLGIAVEGMQSYRDLVAEANSNFREEYIAHL